MNKIGITVEPNFLPHHSDLNNEHYVFSYTITIENQGDKTVTLRRRYWEITDAMDRVETVSGEGVVGEQPSIYPGEHYIYSSSAHLKLPWGSMQGHYEFEDIDGNWFHAPIPCFELNANITLH